MRALMSLRRLAMPVLVLCVAACAGTPPLREPPRTGAPSAPPPTPSSKYYLDDGPGLEPPPNLDAIADAVPRLEALHRAANRPYAVLGREYVPATSLKPYRERGIASWYGRKFHGQKTSTGEPMFTGFMRTRPGSSFWAWFYSILYFLQSGWPAWAGNAAGASSVSMRTYTGRLK